MRATLKALPIAVLLVSACDGRSVRPVPFGDDKRVPGDCYVEATTPLAPDADSPLGFKPSQALALLEQIRTGVPLEYRDRSRTQLTVSFQRTGDPLLVEYEQTGNPALDEPCGKRVTADGLLHFRTDDGRFDESLKVTATLESATSASWEITVANTEVAGAFDARTLFQPSQLENAELLEVVFDGTCTEEGVAGEISAHVVQAASEDAVGVSFVVAAAWGDGI